MNADVLRRVTSGQTLARAEMRELIHALIAGAVPEAETAAFLAALRTRGETLDEIVGAALAMRERAVVLPRAPAGAIDTCGTGGDGSGTFNISTVSALVVAAAGVPVAKHGNRAATSRCGSAEVLEALGIRLELDPVRMAGAVEKVGIGFLFARVCHPALAAVAPLRARLGFPTLFNRLGPLTNPMGVRRHLVGVARPQDMQPMLDALIELGAERAWVVHGEDGLDEISSCAPTRVAAWVDGRRESFAIQPGAHVPRAEPAALRGGDAAHNAVIARDVLAGRAGAPRDVVLLNAGAALCVAGHAEARDLAAGVALAARVLDAGAASQQLARWVTYSEAELAAERRS